MLDRPSVLLTCAGQRVDIVRAFRDALARRGPDHGGSFSDGALAFGHRRLADLADVRLTLETSIAALAAQHRRPEHLRELERLQQILHQPRKSLAAHVKADGDFHATLAEAAGNPFFSLVLAPIHDLLTESRLQTLRRFGASIAWQHHQRILEAVRSQDADEAARAMEEHLTVNSRHLSEIDEEVDTDTPHSVEIPTHRRKSASKQLPR